MKLERKTLREGFQRIAPFERPTADAYCDSKGRITVGWAPPGGSTNADALLHAVAAKRTQPRRRGRPTDPNSARSRQPWREAGVSQRTFYRLKARGHAPTPVQQAAHVQAWYATLDAIAQLDHRAWVRRCLRGLA